VSGPIDLTQQGNASGSTEVPRPGGNAAGVDVSQRSVGELLREVTSDLSKLVSQELELAKAEMKVEAQKAGKTAASFGAAAVAGYFALFFASWTLLYILKSAFDSFAWAALVVTALYAVAAAVLYKRARATARTLNPKPEQTVQSLKEDAEWAHNRSS
jgi:hypothetical protein